MNDMTNDNPATTYIDSGAVALWVASVANILPSIAALLSIIWFLLRIAESKTVQHMLGRYAWIKKENKDGSED